MTKKLQKISQILVKVTAKLINDEEKRQNKILGSIATLMTATTDLQTKSVEVSKVWSIRLITVVENCGKFLFFIKLHDTFLVEVRDKFQTGKRKIHVYEKTL